MTDTVKTTKFKKVLEESINSQFVNELIQNKLDQKGESYEMFFLKMNDSKDLLRNTFYKDNLVNLKMSRLEWFLDEYNVTIRDMFPENTNWSVSTEDQTFLDCCMKLSNTQKKNLIKILDFHTKEFHPDEPYNTYSPYRDFSLPTGKAIRLFRDRFTRLERESPSIPESLYKACMHHGKSSVLWDEWVEVSKLLDVSLHWLLGLSEKHTIYVPCGTTELIYGYYKLLGNSDKEAFYSAVVDTKGA